MKKGVIESVNGNKAGVSAYVANESVAGVANRQWHVQPVKIMAGVRQSGGNG
jgi:hypothetical protein